MLLIPFALTWFIGLWIALRVTLPSIALGFVMGVAIVGIVLTWRTRKPRWLFALRVALIAILGALRFNLAQPHFDQTTLATYNDQAKPVIVEGVVAAEPDVHDAYTNLRVEADKLAITDQPTRTVRGLVLGDREQGLRPGYNHKAVCPGRASQTRPAASASTRHASRADSSPTIFCRVSPLTRSIPELGTQSWSGGGATASPTVTCGSAPYGSSIVASQTRACVASQLWTLEPYRAVSLSQTFAASGHSCLGNNAMALFGHAALHTPHPKHLVGSI